MTDADQLIAAAIGRAPAHMADVAPKGRAEAELEDALRAGLAEVDAPSHCVGARRRYIDTCWDPLPRGLDLYMTHPGTNDLWWVAELKYEKVHETLWDLIKVSCAFWPSAVPPAPARLPHRRRLAARLGSGRELLGAVSC